MCIGCDAKILTSGFFHCAEARTRGPFSPNNNSTFNVSHVLVLHWAAEVIFDLQMKDALAFFLKPSYTEVKGQGLELSRTRTLEQVLEGIEPFHPSCVISSWAQLRGGVHPPDCGSFSWPSASRWCSSPAGWELVSSAFFQKHLRDSNWQPSNQPTGQLVWPPAHCCLFTAANVYRRNWWGRSSSERDFFFLFSLLCCLVFTPKAL